MSSCVGTDGCVDRSVTMHTYVSVRCQLRGSAIPVAGGSIPGSQFGEPSFTFGGQKSLMAVTFLVYGRRYFMAGDMAGDIFISQSKYLFH